MITSLVNIRKEGESFVLFNKRGAVIELNKKEYALFKKYANKKRFPKENTDFFNRLCYLDMVAFENYTPYPIEINYSTRLYNHDNDKPLYPAPVIAHLGITSRCNMRCSYCSIRKPYEKNHELTTDEWKIIIKKLSGLGVYQVGFTGGEPTLREDLPELAEYVEELGCTFNLTTNGKHIEESLIRRLRAAGMRQCQLSLDSSVPEINDALRGKGAFSNLVKTIKLLKRYDIIIGIDCVVSNNNIKQIPSFVVWLKQNEIPYLTMIKIKKGDLPIEEFKRLLPDYESYSRLIDSLCTRVNEYPCITLDCGSVSNLQYTLKDDELHKVPTAGCPLGHTLLSISPNGDLFPCVALSGKRHILGNALKDDIKDIWNNSDKLKELRGIKQNIKGKCKSCSRLNLCRGGCRGIVDSLQEKFWESDESCRWKAVY